MTDRTVGNATGTAATVRDQGELERFHHRVAAEEGDGQDEDHQGDSDDDEEIADLQDRLLEMADGMGLLDKLSGLAEIRVLSGGVDQSVDFALPHDGTRVHGVFRLPCYGQGFSRQRGLVHFDRVAGQQFGVCRHDVADPQPYHVAGDQFAGRDRAPGAVSLDLRPQCQLLLERGDGIAGLVLLPEPNDGVDHQKRKNDPEIRPMTDDRR